MGLKDTGAIKDLLVLLCGQDCILPYVQAILAARNAVFAIEDGSISLNVVFRGKKTYKDLQLAATRYYSQLLEKHPAARTIVLTSDDFKRVTLAKKATQEKRSTGEDKKAFSPEELGTFGRNAYMSRLHDSSDARDTLRALYEGAKAEFREAHQADPKKQRNGGTDPTMRLLSRSGGPPGTRPARSFKFPAVYDTEFKWYMTRLLSTRPYKPDAAFHFYWLLVKEHHAKNIVYRQDEARYMPEGQQLIFDGVPWTAKLQRAAALGRGNGNNSWTRGLDTLTNGGSAYVRGPIDRPGDEEGTPYPVHPAFLSKYYRPEDNDGSHTCMLGATRSGLHLLPEEWRTVQNEADHKIVAWLRRMVAQIRSPHPSENSEKGGESDDELPVLFVTTLDTDAFPMILAALEELYAGDPENIDFMLYVDMTPQNTFPLLYADICEYAGDNILDYIRARDEEHRGLFAGRRGDRALGCCQVFDYTTLWMRLRGSLAELLPGARYPLYSFVALLCACGTDYVPEFAARKPRDYRKAFFMGGYLLVDRAIGLNIVDHGPLGHRLLVSMNETYMNDFVRLVLTLNARTVTAPIFSELCPKNGGNGGKGGPGDVLSMFSTRKFRQVESAFNTSHVASPKLVGTIRGLHRKSIYDEICKLKKLIAGHKPGEVETVADTQHTARVQAACARIMRTAKTQLSKAIAVDLPRMRGEFVCAVRNFSSYCVADKGVAEYIDGHRMVRRFILGIEELEERYRLLKRQTAERKRGGGSGPNKRSRSNGLFQSAPSPSPQQRENPTPFEEWARRPLSMDALDVFIRMIHHNLWLWTSATHKDWRCVTEVTDARGTSYSGYQILRRRGSKRVLFAKKVGDLSRV